MAYTTLIQCGCFQNLVSHECSLGEFAKDLQRETKEFLSKNKGRNYVDIFWHLDAYCEKHYGPCCWQVTSIDRLLESIKSE